MGRVNIPRKPQQKLKSFISHAHLCGDGSNCIAKRGVYDLQSFPPSRESKKKGLLHSVERIDSKLMTQRIEFAYTNALCRGRPTVRFDPDFKSVTAKKTATEMLITTKQWLTNPLALYQNIITSWPMQCKYTGGKNIRKLYSGWHGR